MAGGERGDDFHARERSARSIGDPALDPDRGSGLILRAGGAESSKKQRRRNRDG
jgi:hypothetical protein